MLDDQAMMLLNGKHLNKKVEINYPIQLDKVVGKEIKNTLANYGVHANYEALETRGSVPKVVEKGIGISYPIEKQNKQKGRICRWRKDTTRDRN
jgi:hypothetical protein